MLEPWRSRYLASLGIVQYVAKCPLVGAASSRVHGWDTTVSAATDLCQPEVVAAKATVVEEPTSRSGMQPLRPDSLHEIFSGPEQTPRADHSTTRDLAPPSVDPSPTQPKPYTLLFVTLGGRILVVDKARSAHPEMEMYQQLLRNIGRAIGADVGPVEVFRWPLMNHPQLTIDAEAGRDAAIGRLLRHIESSTASRLLLLGDATEQLDSSALGTVGGVITSWATAETLSRCFEQASAKRSLWDALKQLALDE